MNDLIERSIGKIAKQEEKYVWEQIKEIIIQTGSFDVDDWILERKTPYKTVRDGNEVKIISEIRLMPRKKQIEPEKQKTEKLDHVTKCRVSSCYWYLREFEECGKQETEIVNHTIVTQMTTDFDRGMPVNSRSKQVFGARCDSYIHIEKAQELLGIKKEQMDDLNDVPDELRGVKNNEKDKKL